MVEVTAGVAVNSVTTVFMLSTMLSIGLELTIDEILTSLRQWRLMARSLLVNLVIVPLLAFILILAIPIETEYAIGLLLIAMAPGAPFGPKLAEVSKSDIAFASGLMAVLAIISVATIPATVAFLMPSNITADPLGIAKIVIAAQLIPLTIGLGVKAHYQPIATHLLPPVRQLSTYSFILLIGVLLVANIDGLLRLIGTRIPVVLITVVSDSLLLGYTLGGPAQGTREVLATTTTARNAAIALLIATTSFPDPRVLTMIIAFGIISIIISGLVAGGWR